MKPALAVRLFILACTSANFLAVIADAAEDIPMPTLYYSQQTGEFSVFKGARGYTADNYESGTATLSATGPIIVTVNPALTLARNERKDWTGQVDVKVSEAPSPGSSAWASVTGSYEFTYYDYHAPGQNYVKTGTAVMNLIVASIKVESPDTVNVWYRDVITVSAVSYPSGGEFTWSCDDSHLMLANTNQQTVNVTNTGAMENPARLVVNYRFSDNQGGWVNYADTTMINYCAKLDDFTLRCAHDRSVKSGDTLEVVPQLIGETIKLQALPAARQFGPNYPKWTVSSLLATTHGQGATDEFSTFNIPVPVGMFWLFNIVPKSYIVTGEDSCGNSANASVLAYPNVETGVTWNVGEQLEPLKRILGTGNYRVLEITFPSNADAKISFNNGWKERASEPSAYLWFEGGANLDPFLGIKAHKQIFPGPIGPPSWITRYADIGIYINGGGKLSLTGTIERGENGAAGSITLSGEIFAELEAIVRAGRAIELSLTGRGTVGGEISVTADEGWLQREWQFTLGELTASSTIMIWDGTIEVSRSWLIFEGFPIPRNSEPVKLWQYAR